MFIAAAQNCAAAIFFDSFAYIYPRLHAIVLNSHLQQYDHKNIRVRSAEPQNQSPKLFCFVKDMKPTTSNFAERQIICILNLTDCRLSVKQQYAYPSFCNSASFIFH